MSNGIKAKADTITDLTGYTWVGNEHPKPFHEADFIHYHINYISNNNTYNDIYYDDDGDLLYGLRYINTSTSSYNDVYTYQWDAPWQNGTWSNEAYKTIEITGGTDATNSTLIAWLEENGTLTAPAPAANTYSITHTLSNLTKGNITFTITPDTGYSLPATSSDITVTNGTIVSYNNQTGVLVINGDDTTEISCECPSAPSGYEVEIQGTTGYGEYIYVQINDDPTWYYAQMDSQGHGFWVNNTNIPNAYQKNTSSSSSIGIPNVTKIKIGTQGNPISSDGPHYGSRNSSGDFTNLTFTYIPQAIDGPNYSSNEITMTQDSRIFFTGDF